MRLLSFDEIKVRIVYMYNKANDHTLKPYNYVQVAVLRGFFGKWKQPIFYAFDCTMTKAKLFEIIKLAENAGFLIVAMVNDWFYCLNVRVPQEDSRKKLLVCLLNYKLGFWTK